LKTIFLAAKFWGKFGIQFSPLGLSHQVLLAPLIKGDTIPMQGGEDLSVAGLSRVVAPPKTKRARPLNEAERLGARVLYPNTSGLKANNLFMGVMRRSQ